MQKAGQAPTPGWVLTDPSAQPSGLVIRALCRLISALQIFEASSTAQPPFSSQIRPILPGPVKGFFCGNLYWPEIIQGPGQRYLGSKDHYVTVRGHFAVPKSGK